MARKANKALGQGSPKLSSGQAVSLRQIYEGWQSSGKVSLQSQDIKATNRTVYVGGKPVGTQQSSPHPWTLTGKAAATSDSLYSGDPMFKGFDLANGTTTDFTFDITYDENGDVLKAAGLTPESEELAPKDPEPDLSYVLDGWLWGKHYRIAVRDVTDSPVEAVVNEVFHLVEGEEVITVLVKKADGSTEIRTP